MVSAIGRVARWLQARSITMQPEQIGLAEGLRAATVVASMVLLAELTGNSVISWAAFSAFWTCLVDPGGPTRIRLLAMIAFAVLGSVLALAASYAGSRGAVIATPALMLMVFAGALVRLVGPRATQAGVLASVVAAVAVDYPGPLGDDARLAGIFLGGSLWAMLVCLVIWRLHPFQPARRAVSAIYRDLGAMCAALRVLCRDEKAGEKVGFIDEAEHRRAVRGCIERARSVLDRIAVDRREGRVRRDLSAAIDTGDRILAGLIALEHDLPHDSTATRRATLVAILDTLADALTQATTQLLLQQPDPSGLAAAAELFAAHTKADRALDGRLAKLFAENVGDLARRWRSAPSEEEEAVERGAIPVEPRQMVLRHAARIAVTVGLARLVIGIFDLPYGYWATVAVIVVMQPSLSITWPRMVERVIGSISGGFLATALVALLPTPPLMLIAIFPVAAATIALRSVNYTLFCLFLTVQFVLVADMISPGEGFDIALSRAVNNLLGSLFSFAGCLLLWRDPPPTPLGSLLGQAVEANIDYAVQVLRGREVAESAVDAARKRAGSYSTAAEIGLQRRLLEGRRLHGRDGSTAALLSALRRLAGAATATWLGGDAPDPDGALCLQRCGQLREDLLRIVAEEGGQKPIGVVAMPDTPIGRALAEIVADANLYAAAKSSTQK